MTDTLTGSELAATIEKVVTMLPDNHDQGSWFFTYDVDDNRQAVDPESIQLVQILDAVEAGEAKAKEVKCNTTLCSAGWAVMLNGYTLAKDTYGYEKAFKDGEEFEIADLARDLLDIDKRTADVLFDGDTSNDDAVEIMGYIGRGDKSGAADYITEMFEDDYDDYGRCGCGCEDDDRDDYDY